VLPEKIVTRNSCMRLWSDGRSKPVLFL
jgi:hypothetical protein